jgi:hypothetical protein
MSLRDERRAAFMEAAPEGLKALLRVLTFHHKVNWNAPDYISADEFEGGTDGRQIVESLEDAEAVSSLRTDTLPMLNLGDLTEVPGDPAHALLLDLDVPVWLVPSSTGGHGHLYADLRVPEEDLWAFIEAAVKIGLVEDGYLGACKSRGMTSLRAPWVRKGEEQS